MYKRAQKGVGYLPQEASVFRKMSVEDNIMSVMEMSTMPKAERQERLEDLSTSSISRKVRKSFWHTAFRRRAPPLRDRQGLGH